MEFRCKVDANPFVASTIQWKLPLRPQDPGRKWQDRSQIVIEDGVSILRLSGIERTDMGEVICEASNGVKNVKKTAMTYLIVNRKCVPQCGNVNNCKKSKLFAPQQLLHLFLLDWYLDLDKCWRRLIGKLLFRDNYNLNLGLES